MPPMTADSRLKARLPDIDKPLRDALLQDARDLILSYTGQPEIPAPLIGAQVQLAIISYNRMGIEGESGHSEGGVSRTMELLPEDIRQQLNRYRLAKVVSAHAPAGG